MLAKIQTLALLIPLVISQGCAICCSPYDDEYNCYGGVMDRADRVNGRVGSRFMPAESEAARSESDLGQPPLDSPTEIPLEARLEMTEDWDLR